MCHALEKLKLKVMYRENDIVIIKCNNFTEFHRKCV